MVNEHPVEPKTPSLWQNANRYLFEPHATVTEVGARREARLISIINFLFAISGLLGAASIFGIVGPSRNVIVLIGLAVLAIAAYILSRMQFYKIGSYVIVWVLVAIAFGTGDEIRLTHSLHINLILAFLIASVTFPFRYMVFFVIFTNVAIGLTPFFYPEYSGASVVLGLFVPFSLLTLAVMRHRDNVERDRLASSRQLNHQLSTLKQELEQSVEQRSLQLEERARQLQVVTEVARTAASFQDLERLLTGSTRLISESFGFYHVGIFLLDETGQFAVLRAANSEGGQRMLSRLHTLPIDLNSIVGYAAKTQTPRIALDTGEDSVYFTNPDLPETRSEMALPLKVGLRLIGILDVQSTHKDAFSDEDIAILETVGDQLAIAIDNTRLLSETRRALVTAEETYQRYFSQAWSQVAHRQDIEGYRYHDGTLTIIEEENNSDQVKTSSNTRLSIPLSVRGQKIGSLEVQLANEEQAWNQNEIAVLEAAAERAALALENARLLQDAQRSAAREHIISEITSTVTSSIDIDQIMRSAAHELGRKLGGAEVIVELGSE